MKEGETMATKVRTLMKRGRIAGTCHVAGQQYWVIVRTDGDGVKMMLLSDAPERVHETEYRIPAGASINVVNKEDMKRRFPTRWEQIAKQFPKINQ